MKYKERNMEIGVNSNLNKEFNPAHPQDSQSGWAQFYLFGYTWARMPEKRIAMPLKLIHKSSVGLQVLHNIISFKFRVFPLKDISFCSFFL